MLLSEKTIDFLTASEPFAIESDFDIDESVRRLTASTKRPLLPYYRPVFIRSAVVGDVAAHDVCLWLERPFLRTSCRPMFIGRFQLIGKKVILIGKITLSPSMNVFLGFYLVISAFWTIFTLANLVKHPSDPLNWSLPLFGPVIVFFGVGMAHLGKWLSSADVPWILHAIAASLREHPMHST